MSESIAFRPATPQDVGAMTLVLMRANARRDGEPLPITTNDDAVVHMQERVDNPDRWAYVATDGEKVVGYAIGYSGNGVKDSDPAPNTEYLAHLMVEPDYWGRRIAGRLIDIVANRARNAGKQQLTLWTREEDNTHARGMYEHKGFRLTGLTQDSQYGGQVHYELAL